MQQWFDEYAESHQNQLNKRIHWICVPVIFFSIVCLFSLIPIAGVTNLATITMIFVLLFYVTLSPFIAAVGIALFYGLCFMGIKGLGMFPFPIWQSAIVIFIAAWLGQFYGHKIEGKKPSFLKDLQFLLIGPAWLLSFIFDKLGIRYT